MCPSFQRSIVHLDADAFFASVEEAADTRLRGKPIAVGGEKRGIIASASYAARRFGIYTPMPTAMARRLCPKLIVLPGDFEKYELFSRLMFSYAYDFTPEVEIGSIDEGYFDLTGVRKPAVSIAETIRCAIRQSLRLSVSEGIADNKLVSQIASKLKKPSAFQFVPHRHEAEFLSPLPNKWLPGVGPKTAVRLNAAGLARIGQVAGTPPDMLSLLVGSQAPQLRNFALGIDARPVVPACAPAKSYGQQETFAADTTDEEFLDATLRRMADKLMAKVRADDKSIRTVTVKVRYNDMDEEQASQSLDEPTDLEAEIYSLTSALLRKAWKRRVSLRLVSLKLSNIYDGRFRGGLGLDTSSRQHDARQRLAGVVDELQRKYGRGILLRGHDFTLRGGRSQPQNPPVPRPKKNLNKPIQTNTNQKSPHRLLDFGSNASKHVPHRKSQIIPLHLHSYYSFLDSTLSIRDIIDLARRHHLSAIALTDTNNLHGAVEFTQAALAAGIKPILGAELQYNGHRLCLYVQNQTGYHNLCRILSSPLSQTGVLHAQVPQPEEEPIFQTYVSKIGPPSPGNSVPFLDTKSVLGCTDGLLAVSPAAELARFFSGRFYLETNSPEAFAKRPASLPCIVSLPVHYQLPSDRWKYDVVQSIRTLTLLRQSHPEKRLEGDYHFRSQGEMGKLFGNCHELLAHTHELAERCSFQFSLGVPQFPSYQPPDGSTPAAFLRRLVMEGLVRRYPGSHARLRPQLEQELAIITEVGYEEYFLVMWDILQECRRRGIEWITRGSAADSLACYCLGISGVCPIRFDLYFRRFLNKDRMSLNKLPDIDVDFPHDRKDEVIDLIFEKYGPAHTAIVGGFSTFQSRSAFAEAAKVLGVSEFQVRRLTERLPSFSRADNLAEAVSGTLECRDMPFDQEPYSTALQMGQFLDGFPRYPKMHPCGLVLSRQPMHEITPCFTSAKGYPTSHFDMNSVEAVGLIKMDILAQGGLAVMRDVLNSVSLSSTEGNQGNEERPFELRTSNSELRPSAFSLQPSAFSPQPLAFSPQPLAFPSPQGPWNDPHVWELIAGGNARAVHHIESPAMISLCRMCNVRDIDTLIAIVSVIRPGAANESKKMEFARRYQGLSPMRYPHPSLEPCLRSTYGLVVYEEHILQICEAFAGLPPGRADILRRALGKNNTDLIGQIQIEFADCARKCGRSETEISEVWSLVAGFRGYAFCKAHSTAYGVEAYQSAWLKCYYPAQFMAAVLTNGKGFYQPLVYILECHRLGIPLLPPSINDPGPAFTVVEGKIRVPILLVKGLTRRTKDAILSERNRGEFSSLSDFMLRVKPLPEEMQVLIHAGAFDPFGQTRTRQYWEFQSLSQIPLEPSPRILGRASSPVGGAGLQPDGGPNQSGRGLPHSKTLARCSQGPLDFRQVVECGSPLPLSHSEGQSPNNTANPPPRQLWLFPPVSLDRLPAVPLTEPDRLQRLRWEEELLGYPVSGHPLELYPDIAWDTYCPINRLGDHIGEQVVTCGLVIEQRLFHQVTGEPMKFLTIADWTGIVETELFARTYQSYGLNTVRYRVLEITATVEPFENGRGYSLRVLRAGKPRTRRED